MLRNERGRFMHHNEMYAALGLDPKKHLPAEGFLKEIHVPVAGNILFLCTPAVPGNRKHRIKFACPCGRWIPFGRAGQHLKTCLPYKAHMNS